MDGSEQSTVAAVGTVRIPLSSMWATITEVILLVVAIVALLITLDEVALEGEFLHRKKNHEIRRPCLAPAKRSVTNF